MRKLKPLKRAIEHRPAKRKYIIFTEGKNTEPEYFAALKRLQGATLIEIHIEEAAGAPFTIAKKASDYLMKITRKNKGLSSYQMHDQVWAVFDRDTHPNINDAIQKCQSSNVGIAFSNPCFELWLMLHIREYDRPNSHEQMQRDLEEMCPEYQRNGRKTVNYQNLLSNLKTATARSRSQYQRRKDEVSSHNMMSLQAPFTTMHELIDEIFRE